MDTVKLKRVDSDQEGKINCPKECVFGNWTVCSYCEEGYNGMFKCVIGTKYYHWVPVDEK